MSTKKRDESFAHNKNWKTIQLNGKYYEIDDSINLNEPNIVLPNNDKRNHFRVTLVDNILFYHDSDVVINQNDSKMKMIIKQIILNAPLDLINNKSLNLKLEILVTKINRNELKFERLHKSTLLSTFSLVAKPNTSSLTQNKFPKLSKFLNNQRSELKKSSIDYNNNNDIDLNTKLNNLKLTDIKSNPVNYNNNSNNNTNNNNNNNINNTTKKNIKVWHINDWLKMANKKPQNSNVSSQSTSIYKENPEKLSVTHPKSIISEKEKGKILNFIGVNFVSKQVHNNNESIKIISSKKEENNEIKLPNSKSVLVNNDFEKYDKHKNEQLYDNDCCSSSFTKRSVISTRSSLSISIQTNNNRSDSYSVMRSNSCNRDQYNKRSSLLVESNEMAIMEYFKTKQLEWKNIPCQLIDSHCHFDMLFSKMRFDQTTREYFQKYKHFYLENFEACINVICDPFKYYTKDRFRNYLNKYSHEKVYFTVGCHPHFAESWNEKVEDILYDHAEDPRIIAIGECGLDVSKKNSVSLETQIKAFTAQLQIAKYFQLPIVIHCRDTEVKVYEILKKYLNPKHRIHLHCFTGSWNIAKAFLDTFENLCIGVTPLITFKSRVNPSFVDMVKKIPINRLLLETDSPYFLPQSDNFPIGIDHSHPGFVYATAEAIAKLKNVSLERIIVNTRFNAKRVYGI